LSGCEASHAGVLGLLAFRTAKGHWTYRSNH